MKKDFEQQIKELTLLLLWLTSWKEDEGGIKAHRSWKGYDFSIIDKLKEERLIDFSYKSKSVFLTEKGIKQAEKIKKKYEE